MKKSYQTCKDVCGVGCRLTRYANSCKATCERICSDGFEVAKHSPGYGPLVIGSGVVLGILVGVIVGLRNKTAI